MRILQILRNIPRRAAVLSVALVPIAGAALGHGSDHDERLPVIGPAPDFALISQDERPVTLTDYRGRVVVVTFIYTSCPDVCPLLTATLAQVQDDLGNLFGTQIAFVSITVDPERDTTAVLKTYALDFGANLEGWVFLTGEAGALKDVTARYGIAVRKLADGEIQHTLLTSLIDRSGQLRVQYLGARFDPEEFRRDLLGLVEEPR
jgi:protein SCO1/2